MALTLMLILQLNVFTVSIYTLCFVILNLCGGSFSCCIIREWIVGGYGGGKKFLVVEMPRNNIRCTWVSFSLLGSVFILIKGGSRVNKGDCG